MAIDDEILRGLIDFLKPHWPEFDELRIRGFMSDVIYYLENNGYRVVKDE